MPEEYFSRFDANDARTRPADARLVADLIFDAFPEFYGLIPSGRHRVLEMIADQIGHPRTELQTIWICYLRNQRPIGALAALPAEQVTDAQLFAAMAIMRRLTPPESQEFLARLRGFSKRVEPLPGNSIYLSRLSVAIETRGLGIGTKLMKHFMGISSHCRFSLHVHRENQPIIRLHSKLGFEFASETAHEFRAMVFTKEG